MRSTYPTRRHFQLHRTTGCHDLCVNEYTIRYDDQPVMVVGIMELRDEKVVRERICFGDRWPPPAWRAQRPSGSTLLSRTRRSRPTSRKRTAPTESTSHRRVEAPSGSIGRATSPRPAPLLLAHCDSARATFQTAPRRPSR
jgi:hypothetical protein